MRFYGGKTLKRVPRIFLSKNGIERLPRSVLATKAALRYSSPVLKAYTTYIKCTFSVPAVNIGTRAKSPPMRDSR